MGPLDDLRDRIRGMLWLGVYGDALGALHEAKGFDGEVGEPTSRLPKMPEEIEPRAWFIWAPANLVVGRRGVPTDDSMFRLFMLQRWLLEDPVRTSYDEPAFREFLAGLEPGEEGSWQRHRHAQAVDWEKMFEAAEAEPPQQVQFFEPGKPAVFGLFMLLEMAAFGVGRDPMEVYEEFYGATQLDQGYGRAVTALLATWLADALGRDGSPEEAGVDLVTRLLDVLDHRLAETQDEVELAELADLVAVVERAIDLGVEFRGQDESHFMEALAQRVYHGSDWPYGRNIDPFFFLLQITSVLSFARDPLQALRALAWGVGDSDTVASQLGSLLGARLGYQYLLSLQDADVLLADEFQTLHNVLYSIFDLDLDSRVDVFLRPADESS